MQDSRLPKRKTNYMDPEKVLIKLQEISSRHPVSNPPIGIDSLVLALNTDQQQLMQALMQLRNEEKVILFHNERIANTRNSGRIDDFNKVSLC